MAHGRVIICLIQLLGGLLRGPQIWEPALIGGGILWASTRRREVHVQIAAYAAVATEVPEPTTMLLLGSGLIGLAGYGRKKFFKK